MKALKMVFKNAGRHKLRTFLTIIGISVAVVAFTLLRTVVTAWHSGVEASAVDRLITRHAVSFIFPLTYAYKDKIAAVEGVEQVSFANWFGGVYKDKEQFFARMGVDSETFFEVYPEYMLTPEELENFHRERNACVIGQQLAETYGLEVGDPMNLVGDIYPGDWEFIIRGIYQPKFEATDDNQMFFHWNYLNERVDEQMGGRANEVGWYIVRVQNPDLAATISEDIDALFENSSAATKTETERAFQQSFISSYSALLTAMDVMSFLIIGVILLVVGNTMIMAARERTREYAVLKALGFSRSFLTKLIMGESIIISVLGGGVGLVISYFFIMGLKAVLPKGWFPVFQIEPITLGIAIGAVLFIGIASAIFPIQRAASTRIIDGFRFVG